MDVSIKKSSPKESIIVGALDNNQKGHPTKYQHFCSSNKFVKVTARFLRKGVEFEDNIAYFINIAITFVDQPIVSPLRMPPFEMVSDPTSIPDVLKNPIDFQHPADVMEIDVSGN